MEPRKATFALRYTFFPFLSVLATSLSLTVLRLTGLVPPVLGIRDAGVFRVTVYAIWATITAGVLVRLLHRHAVTLADLGWRGRLSWSGAGLAVLAAWAAAMLWLPFDALRQALHLPLYWNPAQQGFVEPRTAPEFVWLALAGLVLVPLAEETMFRGVVLPTLEARTGRVLGLLLHNVLFALYHLGVGPGLVVYMFFWSFFPGLLYLRYRSLYPCLVMHVTNNLWVDFAVPLLFLK